MKAERVYRNCVGNLHSHVCASGVAFTRLRVLRLSNNRLRSLSDVFNGVVCASLQTLIVSHNDIAHVSDMVHFAAGLLCAFVPEF